MQIEITEENYLELKRRVERFEKKLRLSKLPPLIDSDPIWKSGVSLRLYTVFKRMELKTIKDLKKVSIYELCRTKGCGQKTIDECRELFDKYCWSKANLGG
jgi:DNA-directed RNA polymerase alpha subunit